MSQTIDERIVEMQFDNKQFEKGVQTSLRSIEQLKRGLDLNESARSLSRLEQAGRNFSLAGLASSVDNISGKFTALGIMGVTALQNITNSAINAGKRIVSALTIDPIKTGFAEYETQINAVQTILANTQSKGTTIDQVNAALDELNKYADMTIYNFTEMTRNIGTFTAAGVELDTSVAAIKGIANLAAVSGSTSQQASTAMYQLSQALSSGTVKLQDWNSVVNAGMGGQVFQDALKETARVHGIKIDQMIKEQGSFRETLSKGWLTSEVLLETLKKFTGDLNEEQLKAMGYSDEQIKAIVQLGKTANDAATKVKTFTQLWDTLKEAAQSGWTQTWEILIGDFEEAKELLTKISDTLNALIGASADARNSMLSLWKEKGGRADIIEAGANAFEAILAVVKPIKEAFRDIFPPMTADQLKTITGNLKELTAKFKISDATADKLKRTFKGVFAVLNIGKQAVVGLLGFFKNMVGEMAPACSGLLDFTAALGDWIVGVDGAIKTSDIFNRVFGTLSDLVKNTSQTIRSGLERIVKAFGELTGLDVSSFTALFADIRSKFKPFESISHAIEKSVDVIGRAFDKVAPYFVAFGTAISKAVSNIDMGSILTFFNGGVLSAVLIGAKGFTTSITDIFDTLKEKIEDFGSGKGFLANAKEVLDNLKSTLQSYQNDLKASTLLKIAAAVGILAVSLAVLSSIKPEKLSGALTAMTVLFGELLGSFTLFQKISAGVKMASVIKTTTALMGLSVALLIMSAAVANLARYDLEELTGGIIAIASLSGILVLTAKALSKSSGEMIRGSAGLIAFGIAVGVLAAAVKSLSKLSVEELFKGITSVVVLCTLLVGVVKLIGNSLTASDALGVFALAAAMNMMAFAVKSLSKVDPISLANGLVAFTVVVVELLALTNGVGSPEKLISTAVAIGIIGAALHIFAKAFAKFGDISIIEIGKGLLVMAASLGIIVLALKGVTNALPGAAAILVVSVALTALAAVVERFGGMPLAEIGKGILSLASIFVVLGVAAVVLGPLTPVLFSLAGAVAMFGVAALAVGAGLLAFATGLSILAVSGVAGATALALVVSTLLGLIPMVITAFGSAIVDLAAVITNGAPAIMEAITAIIVSVCTAISTSAPVIVETVVLLLETLLNTIGEHLPNIIQAATVFILGFATGIGQNIPVIVQKGFELVIQFIDGLADAFEKNAPTLMKSVVNLAGSVVDGLVKGLLGGVGKVYEAVRNIGKGILSAFNKELDINSPSKKFEESGEYSTQGYSQGLFKGMSGIKTALSEVSDTVLSNIQNKKKQFFEAGSSCGEALAEGLETSSDMSGFQPVATMSGTINTSSSMQKALRGLTKGATVSVPAMSVEKSTTTHHTFDKLTIEGVNDKNEFVASADYAVDEILTALIRRQSRI